MTEKNTLALEQTILDVVGQPLEEAPVISEKEIVAHIKMIERKVDQELSVIDKRKDNIVKMIKTMNKELKQEGFEDPNTFPRGDDDVGFDFENYRSDMSRKHRDLVNKVEDKLKVSKSDFWKRRGM